MTTNGGPALTVNTGLFGIPHLTVTQVLVSHVRTRLLTARTVIITINVSSVMILTLWLTTRLLVLFLSKTVLLIQVSIQTMELNYFVLNVRKDFTSILRLKVVTNVRLKIVWDAFQRLNVLNVKKILTSLMMGLNVEATLVIVPLIPNLKIIQFHESPITRFVIDVRWIIPGLILMMNVFYVAWELKNA